nr:MAG TPA: hypothetical protein [Bacteriophage sp.]
MSRFHLMVCLLLPYSWIKQTATVTIPYYCKSRSLSEVIL